METLGGVPPRALEERSRGWLWLVALGLLLTAAALCAGLWAAPHLRPALHLLLAAAAVPAWLALPNTWDRRRTLLALLLGSLAVRLILLGLPPTDDLHRYAWEGRRVLAGHDVYAQPPESLTGTEWADADWRSMNHRGVASIYPPGAQAVFAGLAALPGGALPFKVAFVLADLATVAAVARLLERLRRPARWAGLFAFHPLVLLSTGEGHYDSLVALAVALAALGMVEGRGWLAGLAVGLGAQVKVVTAALLPVLARDRRALAGALLATALPWLVWPGALPAFLGNLRHFGLEFAGNGPLHGAATALVGRPGSDLLYLAAVGLAAGWAAWRGGAPARALLAVLAVVVLAAPTVHFWYLVWFLPLAAVYPGRAWVVAGFSFCAYHWAWIEHAERGVWALPPWTQWVTWTPVLLTLWVDVVSSLRRGLRRRPAEAAPQSYAVVVPAYNEERELAEMLRTVAAAEVRPAQVVVADAGSTDQTRQIALAAGAVVVDAPRGRGPQVAAGVAAATVGDVLLVLHADTRLEPSAPGEMLAALAANPGAAGGALGLRFRGGPAWMPLVELLHELRTVLTGNSFGDQGQFFRRSALGPAGGFPATVLMEDVEWSLRLRRAGPTLYLGGGLRASPRRWERAVPWQRLLTILFYVTAYRWGRYLGRDVSPWLYRLYYGPPKPPR